MPTLFFPVVTRETFHLVDSSLRSTSGEMSPVPEKISVYKKRKHLLDLILVVLVFLGSVLAFDPKVSYLAPLTGIIMYMSIYLTVF